MHHHLPPSEMMLLMMLCLRKKVMLRPIDSSFLQHLPTFCLPLSPVSPTPAAISDTFFPSGWSFIKYCKIWLPESEHSIEIWNAMFSHDVEFIAFKSFVRYAEINCSWHIIAKRSSIKNWCRKTRHISKSLSSKTGGKSLCCKDTWW